jgi:hypothetical protein
MVQTHSQQQDEQRFRAWAIQHPPQARIPREAPAGQVRQDALELSTTKIRKIVKAPWNSQLRM